MCANACAAPEESSRNFCDQGGFHQILNGREFAIKVQEELTPFTRKALTRGGELRGVWMLRVVERGLGCDV